MTTRSTNMPTMVKAAPPYISQTAVTTDVGRHGFRGAGVYLASGSGCGACGQGAIGPGAGDRGGPPGTPGPPGVPGPPGKPEPPGALGPPTTHPGVPWPGAVVPPGRRAAMLAVAAA